MKKLLNTLYILTPDSYLYCQNETISVKVGGDEKVRIPAHTIDSILCFGNTTISSPLVSFCAEHGISLSFLSDYGKFYGRIYGPVSGNVFLRKKLFETLNDSVFSAKFVRLLLYAKLANSKNLLLRSCREQSDEAAGEKLRTAAQQLADLAQKLDDTDDIDSMRGIEGVAASTYFGAFDAMIKSKDPQLVFDVRSKHPPENNINALLSFLYMLLKSDMQSALEAVGLDPAAGFLHTLRPGRPSLALDLMEELRSPLCDRLALSLINLNQLQSKDFEQDPSGIKLTDSARKTVLLAWQTRKREMIMHRFLQENIPIGLIPFAQAQLLARFFRGDLDAYPPFIWR